MIYLDPLPILAAGLWGVLIGAVWYHPRVLGTIWMREVHIDPITAHARAQNTWLFSLMGFGASTLMAYVLAHFVIAFDVVHVLDAFALACWTWAGIVVPILCSAYLWEGKSLVLVVINASYWLVTILGMVYMVAFW
jgi:hypothetical protein